MSHYLASADDRVRTGWEKRFCPELWTIDFPRPMMAALTVPDTETLRIDLDFLTSNDLVGLVWASEDRWSHPLLKYETRRDYRGVILSFDWVSGPGVMALDAVNGPVLTIEGRDRNGASATWYVRLWNYAKGSPGSATIELNFNHLRSGFGLDGDEIFTGDIDRMFLSIVPSGFDAASTPLPQLVSTYVELRNVRASGPNSTLRIGDAFVPEHRLRICSGYDDSYHQPPDRLVEQWRALGYRGVVTHYVGMSHFPKLVAKEGGRYEAAGGMFASADAWHRALLRAAKAAGYRIILSMSFELLDVYAPSAWAQRDLANDRALTSWDPPSTLLSPCNTAAVSWLAGVAAAFSGIAATEQGATSIQIGEPWWWVGPSGKPCFYDAATTALWSAEKGSAPPSMADVTGERSTAEKEWLSWLGAKLAEATAAVRDAARTAAGTSPFEALLLFYAPQVLDRKAPDLRLANMPLAWASPAWDILQLEDYDFVTEGDRAGHRRAVEAVTTELGYPAAKRHYFSGFVLNPEDALHDWPLIAAVAEEAGAAGSGAAGTGAGGAAEVFVWAWPQVARDGFLFFVPEQQDGDGEVDAFHDVRFPLSLGFDASGGPEFSTQIAETASGYEQRNLLWANSRLRYDAGLGVRSEADLIELSSFFRARKGQAFAFRFLDPLDHSSAQTGGTIGAADQLLGVGDGRRTSFQLVKRYGEESADEVRAITRPEATSVRVSVGGLELLDGWSLGDHGVIELDNPPGEGVEVRAGFRFDVPVRFAVDRLDISLSGVNAGEIPSVPLVEVRE